MRSGLTQRWRPNRLKVRTLRAKLHSISSRLPHLDAWDGERPNEPRLQRAEGAAAYGRSRSGTVSRNASLAMPSHASVRSA